ncbi:hypothetical protein FF38_09008 [Lucilia cuprina]|uniref:Uncharacterized protein n=1 Tax=Lucilia cuprina TaxID=7375 RepID=A0A0L0BZ11_LUCCU|nr:hypothetical protein FF38_09008 [Lucilia cuprina]
MLQRFILLEEAIISTMALIDKKLPTLSQKEWLIMKNLVTIFKLFEDAKRNISGDSYCSASLVILITNGLINVYSKIKTNEYSHEIMSIV